VDAERAAAGESDDAGGLSGRLRVRVLRHYQGLSGK